MQPSNPAATQCFGTRASHPQQPQGETNATPAQTRSGSNVSPNSPDSRWIDRRVEQYVVRQLLGCGGMGEVYLAEHRWLDIPVAIKILRPAFGQDAVAVERFHREARLAAKLNHPNIVRAIDGGTVEDTCYLVTEYLDGFDLEQLVQQTGPLPPAQACWIICQMADALQHAHEHQLIHRDIKPQNAMLLKNGSVKLLDLGLARAQWTDAATQMTATGQFMGTVDYVSPEQALDTSAIDHRADIYSLGCTMYFLLTGRPPFAGAGFESVVSKILAHTDETPESIAFLCRGLPRDVIRVLESMMAKDPEDRIQSAAKVSKLLQPFAAPIDAGSNLPSLGSSTSATTPRNKDLLERVGDTFFKTVWLVLRTLLTISGIIERVEIPGPTRIATKPKYRRQVSIKGLMTWAALIIVGYVIFSNIEIVEVGPPPGTNPGPYYQQF